MNKETKYMKAEDIEKLFPEMNPPKLRRWKRDGFLKDTKPMPPKGKRFLYSVEEIKKALNLE
jgi:hypothetical protein